MAAASPSAHDPVTTRVTYAREVRAILAAHCVICHAPGGSAPMPLTTYDETRPWARAIKEQVLARRMPRWHAARGFGSFANDPTLTPFEIALLVAWVDGGLPRDMRAVAAANPANTAPLPSASDPPALARPKPTPLQGVLAIALPAGVVELTRPIGRRWVTGWDFQPGNPLITSATLSLADGTPIGAWAAGDRVVRLPPDSAIRVSGRLRIELHRRARADYEHDYTERSSVLRLATQPDPPAYRVWTIEGACGSVQGTAGAQAIAVRPEMSARGSAQLAVERIGAAPTLVGWFREFDPAYARTYWLQRPLEFGADARLANDAPCRAGVMVRARYR